MANNGIIDQIVSKEALAQLKSLGKELSENSQSMRKLITEAQNLNSEIGKVGSMKEMISLLQQQSKASEKAAEAGKTFTDIVSKSSSCFKTLSGSLDEMYKMMSTTTESFNTITTATGKTGKKLQEVSETTRVVTTTTNAAGVAVKGLSKAFKYLNIATAVIAVIGELVSVFTKLISKTSIATEMNKKFIASSVAEKTEIDQLFDKLESATEGTHDYNMAKKAILDKYGTYLKGLGDEIESLKDVKKAYQAISVASLQSAKDRAMGEGSSKAGEKYSKTFAKNAINIRDAFIAKFDEKKGSALFVKLRRQMEQGLDPTEFTDDVKNAISEFDKHQTDRFNHQTNNNPINLFVKNIRIAKTELDVEMKEIKDLFAPEKIDDPFEHKRKSIEELEAELVLFEKGTEIYMAIEQELAEKRAAKAKEEAEETAKVEAEAAEERKKEAAEAAAERRIQAAETAAELADITSQTAQIKLKAEADVQLAISQNEKESYEVRINAAKNYNNIIQETLAEQKSAELKAIEDSTENEKIKIAKKLKLEADYNAKKEEALREAIKLEELLNDENRERETEKALAALEKNIEIRKAILQKEHDDKLSKLEEQLEKKEITEEEYNKQTKILSIETAQSAFEEEVKLLDAFLDIFDIKEDEKLDLQKRKDQLLLDGKQATADAMAAIAADEAKKEEAAMKKVNAAIKELQKEAWTFAQSFISGHFKKIIQGYDDEKSAIDKATEKELSSIEKKQKATISQLTQEGATKEEITAKEKQFAEEKMVIEERAATQTEQLEKKKRDMQTRQAHFEKALAITKTTIEGIRAAVEALPNYILAGIIGATTALQVATIASQPIPQYATGTANHPGGLAIVGDGGKREMILEPSGKSWITDSKPTLVDLPRHSMVLPDVGSIAKDFDRMQQGKNTEKNPILKTEENFIKLANNIDKSLAKHRSNLNINDKGIFKITKNIIGELTLIDRKVKL